MPQSQKTKHAGLRKFYSCIADDNNRSDAMNLAVFGAGASFVSDTLYVPPLGNKLFDALTAFAPATWGKLPEKYRELFQNDFEQGMQ